MIDAAFIMRENNSFSLGPGRVWTSFIVMAWSRIGLESKFLRAMQLRLADVNRMSFCNFSKTNCESAPNIRQHQTSLLPEQHHLVDFTETSSLTDRQRERDFRIYIFLLIIKCYTDQYSYLLKQYNYQNWKEEVRQSHSRWYWSLQQIKRRDSVCCCCCSYEKYYVMCSLTHNGKNLFKPVQSKRARTYRSFFYHAKWDEL